MLWTVFDKVYGTPWLCCVPEEAVPMAIKKVISDLNREIDVGVRKTTKKDIVKAVPRYNSKKK